jgi:membrane protease YdiL (CAAX protease family)
MENNNFNNRVDNYQPYGYRQENNTNEYFEKQQEKKNDKKILKTIGALCGFSIVIYFVASTLVGVTVAFLNKYLPNLDFVYEQGLGSWAFSSIATVLFIGLPFLATYIVLRKKKITGILPLGTTYNKKASTYLVVAFLPLTLLSTFLINFISLMVQSFMGVDFTSGMEDMAVTNVKDFLFMTLFVAVIPAILEEVAIRGVLLQPLRRFGDGFAIVVSAVIFSLLHGNMVQIPYTVIAGIYFGYVMVATGSLWPSIILHFFNNFYSVMITAFDSNFSITTANVVTLGTLGLMTVAGIFAFNKYRSMNYKVNLAKGVNSLNIAEKIKSVFVNVPMIIAIILMVVTTLTSISES